MNTPRPEWPEGHEPVNGGLWVASALAWLAIGATILVFVGLGIWLLWWAVTMVEAL